MTSPSAPFFHPSQEPLSSSPPRLARATHMVLQIAFVLGLLAVVRQGGNLGLAQFLFAAFGLWMLANRTAILAQILQAIKDRREGLSFTPWKLEIAHRAVFLLVLPYLLLAYTTAQAADSLSVYTGVILISALAIFCRLMGMNRWQTPMIDGITFRHLIYGRTRAALDRITEGPAGHDQATLEASLLAVSNSAMRENDPAVIRDLLAAVERGHPSLAEDTQSRVAAILRADLARTEDPAACVEDEARALMLTPPGHPRRLSLALFVATGALDHDDASSAAKALAMLHPRDVSLPSARVAVNWLMMQAAVKTRDLPLVVQCRRALRTFDLAREAERIRLPGRPDDRDPYDRWLSRAKEEIPTSLTRESRRDS